MRKLLMVAAVATCLTATPALADDRSNAQHWETAYFALSAVDAAETITCLKQHQCEEGNPIFGKHPSAVKLIAGKVVLGGLHYAVFRRMLDRNPHTALRYAQISVGLQGAVVGFNARIFF